jgi:ribose transport system ATP-binding protein
LLPVVRFILDSNILFGLNKVSKRFPGVLALNSVSLRVKAGEVHGLIGENGAGKSTLIKIITGAHAPDEGEIFFDGVSLTHLTPRKSIDLGIACIYQELNLIPHMAVYENIFLGREPVLVPGTTVMDRRKMYNNSKKILGELGLTIDPKARTGSLGLGQQQMVEISKAVSAKAKLIIMDEPTASLSEKEVAELGRIIGKLKKNRVTIIYISHRLNEIKEICDSITVLRDGKTVGCSEVRRVTVDDIIKMMVGRDITRKYPKVKTTPGEELLSVTGLSRKRAFRNISFSVRAGEILGMAGLVGSGRTGTVRAITGADPIDRGQVMIRGKPVVIKSPRDSIKAGIAFLTEDRKGQGLILIQNVEFNTTLVCLKAYARFCLLKIGLIRKATEQIFQELRIRVTGAETMAGQLSGGNQQKVVIAKWLLSKARIFIFDEPTRGIDVDAKIEVYNLMNRLVSEGAAVIMISSEMDECIGMSDRIIVMHEGRITAEFNRDEVTQEKIMYAAAGIANDIYEGL